jgi:hypothetical protein
MICTTQVMLVEAAVHYYYATGKAKLSNYMCSQMGPAPKKNIIPAHAGPEEAFLKVYWLFKDHPDVKKKLSVPVDENSYYQLVQWWIENRGNHCGLPDWEKLGLQKKRAMDQRCKIRGPGIWRSFPPFLGFLFAG